MPRLSPGPRHGDWSPVATRYVALDVDGTLVGPGGVVADEVVEACRAAQDAGLHVGLATGRMAMGVTAVLDRTGLHGPHLLHNGGEVRMDGELVAATPIATPTATALVEDLAARGIYIEVYVDDGFVVTTDDPRAEDHWEILGHGPLAVVTSGDELERYATSVPKVTAIAFEPDEVAGIVELLEGYGLKAGPAGSPATPHLSYVNGTDPAADKGNALRKAAEALGIGLEETVAVGDAGNDLPLLAVAGTAIAMGQADDEVRAAAHLLAPSITDHGVAVALHAAIEGFPASRVGPPDGS